MISSSKDHNSLPFYSDNVLIKHIGSKVIISNPKFFKIIKLNPVVSKVHKLIHKYEKNTANSFKFLEKIIENPKKILKVSGNKITSLLILLAFNEFSKNSELFLISFNSILKSEKLGKTQKKILKLFIGDLETLKDLLYSNPRAFLTFINRFNLKNIEIFNKEINILKQLEKVNMGFKIKSISKDLNIHRGFCLDSNIKPIIFSNEYQKIIDGILKNEPSNNYIEFTDFYPEIELYNSFLFSMIDKDFFEKDLLNRCYVTKNEVLIKKFVEKKLKSK